MAAKDYKLCVSPLTGTVYISKVSKTHKNTMTSDRVVVDKSEFIDAFIQWFQAINDESKEMTITDGDMPIFHIHDLRKS